ncbi:MAG: hypothetical protein MJY71_04125 [Bacteroidaceae bacterium]|nr:hypothetical protein [Bacteroidaceae bacterium]
MVLKDRLYKVSDISVADQQTVACIELLKDSDIYKGHFPGRPITPGVALVQIAVELASLASQSAWGDKHEYNLEKASNIKFLKEINPEELSEITYIMAQAGKGFTKVEIRHNDSVLAKMSLKFINA